MSSHTTRTAVVAVGAVLTAVLTLMQGVPFLRWVYDSRSLLVLLALTAGPVLLWYGMWTAVRARLARRAQPQGGVTAVMTSMAWATLTGSAVAALTAAGFTASVALANRPGQCDSWCGMFSTLAAAALATAAALGGLCALVLLAVTRAARRLRPGHASPGVDAARQALTKAH